ncbi:arylamine N-acetyltransferase [Burkholderia sp. JP2-270]|uniref:arylamine N-acetyltransferase family protein n=1 Tax=Burkholderia sp. JP2-270 TaxID=2217913 RepID=UPI000DA2749A|nr:arylamine N-acetyltransferase [Burkholderia sp. JP2-270]AWV04967.1 arylamine N-acetyltransferase [Burkholderia sp. JP2-270]
MKAENFILQHYFERIGFEQPAVADIATISAMMRKQLFTVPFENLDVLARKGVSLAPEDIVEKILHRKRGGYCYEVNGVFAMALQALGVPYQFVAARPMFYPVKRPKTHMAIVLTLNGEQWLCDLGFGSYGIRAPMRLDVLDVEVNQDCDTFMLSKTSDREYLLKARVDGQWANQYAFDLSPQEWIDFAPANYLNSTHPDAIFVQKMLIVLHNETGRKILFGDTLKTVSNGQTEQRMISPEGHAPVLFREFGLGVDGH